jgi:hypothetical protein
MAAMPAIQVRDRFNQILDYILPAINRWTDEITDLDTIDEQFDYVCSLTQDPIIAKDIFLLAKQFQRRDKETSFPLALLWVYLTGRATRRNEETANYRITRASEAIEQAVEVGGFWGSIKKVAKSVYKGAKKTVKKAYKGGKKIVTSTVKKAYKSGKTIVKKAKKWGKKAIGLTKKAVFWAIKKVFGKKIGGFITNAIELLVGTASQLAFGMLWAVIKTLIYLIKGQFKKAVLTLIDGINKTILTPLLAPLAVAMKIKYSTFKRILKRAAKKNRALALQLVSLVFSTISGNVNMIVTQAIVIMRPIILAFVAEIKKGSKKTQKAIDVGLSIILMIVQGVGSLDQILDSIAAKLKITSAKAIKLLKSNFRNAIKAIAKFNLKKFLQYLLKAVSPKNFDKMRRAPTTPSVERLMQMKSKDVNRFMELSIRQDKGATAINRALQDAKPKVIMEVISKAAKKNPKIITQIIRGSKAQGQILEMLSAA